MVASDKIQEAKNCFKDIKESGRNNYQKYSYMETKDIFPIIRTICKKFKLKTQFSKDIWKDTPVMKLTITDQEDKSIEEFLVNVPVINANDPGKYMQDVGRVQTYAMRYLYIQAFEIAVPDEIDNKDQTKIDKKFVEKKGKTKESIKNAIVTSAKPITTDEINVALDKAYDTIVIKGGKEFTEESALWQLKRICKNNPVLLDACKENLRIYTANKIKTIENQCENVIV